ncbi:hypothetical protein ABW21_db0205093 [Orbilia brochopaga]|nr:hypothetical protein ABW21_db0205093 [Drechslerella brochopaga]
MGWKYDLCMVTVLNHAIVLLDSEQLGTENFIHTSLPHALSGSVMNALKANPLSVSLREFATHFYALGERMVNLVEDAEEELVDILSDTFRQRAIEIADYAANSKGVGERLEFTSSLDETERQVYLAAHASARAMKSWRAEKK